jgi:hypothetical protein
MWAVSDDGLKWTLRDSDPTKATLWRAPSADDLAVGSNYKGLTHVSMVRDDKYFYLMTTFWTRTVVKNVLFRIAADASSPFGISGDPEVWHLNYLTGHKWETCESGRIPDWVDVLNENSVVVFNRSIASIAATTAFPGSRYVSLNVGTGNNRIEYQLSNDVMNWGITQVIRSAVPFFADGRGYANSVITPSAAEDSSGKLHLFFASGDGDDDHGITRDGLRDCSSSAGPTSIFIGSGIYDATTDDIDLIPTVTTIEPRSNPASVGPVTFIVRVTSPKGPPNGVVTVFGAGGFSEANVVNGVAEVTYPIRSKGDWIINASFTAPGMPWASSSATVTQRVINPPPRRRAAGR